MANATQSPWPRAILLVDMNAFFASVEQRDFPELQNQPVAVTNGAQGGCVITCSYEARAYGVHTGMRLYEAHRRCPSLIVRTSRPQAYCKTSQQIMQLLHTITPDVEVFSVDEAFLDLTHCQKLYGDPIGVAQLIQQRLKTELELGASIGLSGDKTTAKYAAKLKKPNGLTVIPPWESATRLANVPVTQLCGIGPGVGRFLAQHGVILCGDMQRIPMTILSKRFGNWGKRLWWMCQGADPDPVVPRQPKHKTMGHSKILPPHTQSRKTILAYFCLITDKLAARLRRHQLSAQVFCIAWRQPDEGIISNKIHLPSSCQDSRLLMQQCQRVFNQQWQGKAVTQVLITALDPHRSRQPGLFEQPDSPTALHQAVDCINQRYGKHTLHPARLCQPVNRNDVLAWGSTRTLEG